MSQPVFPHRLESRMPSELQLALGGLTLLGTSVGARATAFALPELPADELAELVRPLARAFRGELVVWAPGG